MRRAGHGEQGSMEQPPCCRGVAALYGRGAPAGIFYRIPRDAILRISFASKARRQQNVAIVQKAQA